MMPLPININDLINGRTVEWERTEFKESWNPEDILHSMCAFANDINNWGGGYVIIGIEENNGKPILPPRGLESAQIDANQKKLLDICHKIIPYYCPVAYPTVFQEKNILILWCPGGDNRPYKAPKSLGKDKEKVCFVRRFSSTVIANHSEEQQLFQLAAKIPFDDRINHNAELEDLNITIIKSFLKDVGSELYKTADSINFKDICLQMQIARGPSEYTKPVNAGLLFFSENPEKFFRGAKIEIIEYYNEIGDSFSEKMFIGPLHTQLRDALQYIKNNILKEEIRKVPNQAEALRFFNYPYVALEEALANAIYHKSYEMHNTIEINVRPYFIEILSFPGPIPPITNENLKQERIPARDYRNRRIGDFLKELHLTEGRGTGIPKIRNAMEKNGSPEPIFETDNDRNYFLTVLEIHPETRKLKEKLEKDKQVNREITLNEKQLDTLRFCVVPHSRKEIMSKIELENTYYNFKRNVSQLIEEDLLTFTLPHAINSRYQKYMTTEKGIKRLSKQKYTNNK
jgi:ATP-dependent DNA helicase RecG